MSKTKEMIVDFRKIPTVVTPVVIDGQTVACVKQHKYLGTILDEKLTFEHHVDAVRKKAHQLLYFYLKLLNLVSTRLL